MENEKKQTDNSGWRGRWGALPFLFRGQLYIGSTASDPLWSSGPAGQTKKLDRLTPHCLLHTDIHTGEFVKKAVAALAFGTWKWFPCGGGLNGQRDDSTNAALHFPNHILVFTGTAKKMPQKKISDASLHRRAAKSTSLNSPACIS